MNRIDELESQFTAVRTIESRRCAGITFTPQSIVDRMLDLSEPHGSRYVEIVDAGSGAGRFSLSAAARFPAAKVIAVEQDIQLASTLRTLAREQGLSRQIEVRNEDFLDTALPYSGQRLFLGNPPYVRHHSLSRRQKAWLEKRGAVVGRRFSGLSGLHVYFLVRALLEAREGDRLLMILPSEWLEARYGGPIKSLILQRARQIQLFLFPAECEVFAGTMTTSVVLSLEFGGSTEEFSVALVGEDQRMCTEEMHRVSLPSSEAADANWLRLSQDAIAGRSSSAGVAGSTIELGELFDIHRGQVTGKNVAWIATPETARLIPQRFMFPCITDAKEIFDLAGDILVNARRLRRVIDLPADLLSTSVLERRAIHRYLTIARGMGADAGYIASHRKSWWRVGLGDVPSIVMTYMGRRPPKFAVNGCYARLLNIAHGLYPRLKLPRAHLLRIVQWLNANGSIRAGRTYAGGLVKVEPGDARRIRIPHPSSEELRMAA